MYRDQVAFTRSVVESLATVLGLELQGSFSHLLDTVNCCEAKADAARNLFAATEKMATWRKDESFTTFLMQLVSSLSRSLSSLLNSCQLTDVYLNNGRYMSLCQNVYKAKVLLYLFSREQMCSCIDRCNCPVVEGFNQLNSAVLEVTKKLHLGNSLLV